MLIGKTGAIAQAIPDSRPTAGHFVLIAGKQYINIIGRAELLYFPGQGKHDVFFVDILAMCAGINATVTSVDDDGQRF